MSRQDQTGPQGAGPKTGRGLGKCTTPQDVQSDQTQSGQESPQEQNLGRGRGQGLRRRRGRGQGQGRGRGRGRGNLEE